MTNMIMGWLGKLTQWLRRFWRKLTRKGKGISLLVPFKADCGRRQETWEWLEQYWCSELPGAEIVMGHDDTIPFCKTAAVNDAADRAHGDVLVILDADAYVEPAVILNAAREIRQARKAGERLWYIPYRMFWRMTDKASRLVLESDPLNPLRFDGQPPIEMVEGINTGIDMPEYAKGHWFGALIQIMPREAFYAAGTMDERFRGWGGEDISFMHAVDTLWSKHKTTRNGVIHLWHPQRGATVHERMWAEQTEPGINSYLAWRYHKATGDARKMRELVYEV